LRHCSCALFIRDGRLLLGRRSPAKPLYPGVWDLIGGHARPGETPEVALRREVEEEIGSIPTEFSLLQTAPEPNPEAHGPAVYHVFLVRRWTGPEPFLRNDEHVELGWFTPSEARGLTVADPAYRELFARVEALERGGRWVAYAAALWASVFAVFHVIWAAGWYPLLNAEGARIAFATPWKWWFDVVVAVMCVIAVPVVLAPVMSWGQHVPRRLIYTLAWVGSTLLVLRAGASLVQVAYLAATGRFRITGLGIWEPWFYLGAILFSLSTWHSRPGGSL
jgi:8-oxo-dGTP diphosphatase